jgi:hypothetical protein
MKDRKLNKGHNLNTNDRPTNCNMKDRKLNKGHNSNTNNCPIILDLTKRKGGGQLITECIRSRMLASTVHWIHPWHWRSSLWVINDDTRLLWLTCVLQRQIKLSHGNGNWLGNYGIPAPVDGNHFGFQRMEDKVKDGLVPSVACR